MRIPVMCGALFLFSGLLLAQQPAPMGKIDNSSRNYSAGDGTTLDKHSSDEVVARAVQQGLSNDPELSDVQVQVKHHRVTLRGSVYTKAARERAETIAEHTESVRAVRDHVKIGEPSDERNAAVSDAH